MRRLLPRLVLLMSSLTILALILEGTLRIAFYHSRDFAIEMWKYAVQLKLPVSNPDLCFIHVPQGHAYLMGVDVDINSRGLRDHEYSDAKSPGTYRILVLGDSTTFGWGVRLEATVPKLLERRLNQYRPSGIDRFEVLNGGIGNYNTVQELAFYETVGEGFDPDLIILIFFINDPEPVPREKNNFFVNHSYLAAFSSSRVDTLLTRVGMRPSWQTYYASLYDENKPGFRACRAALVRLATFAPKRRLLVALLPELHQINNGSYPFREQHQQIKGILASRNIPVIDLIDGLKDRSPEKSLWVTPDDVHPNAEANALIAMQLENWFWAHCDSRCRSPRSRED